MCDHVTLPSKLESASLDGSCPEFGCIQFEGIVPNLVESNLEPNVFQETDTRFKVENTSEMFCLVANPTPGSGTERDGKP